MTIRTRQSPTAYKSPRNLSTKVFALAVVAAIILSIPGYKPEFARSRYPANPTRASLDSQNQPSPSPWKTMKGHKNWVTSVAFSPDGKTLASGSLDGDVILWDPQTGEIRQKLEGKGNKLLKNILIAGWILAIAFSPDGQLLATGTQNGSVRVWDIQAGTEKLFLKDIHKRGCQAVAFSPNGELLASGGVDNTVKLWSVQTGEMRHALTDHHKQIMGVSFSPDGKLLASASIDKTVKLWDAETGTLKLTVPDQFSVNAVTFFPDGRTLAEGGGNKTIKICDATTGETRRTLKAEDDINALVFSQDGKLIVGAAGKHLQVWDAQTGELKYEVKAHSVSVSSVAISPDGKIIATASQYSDFDKSVKLWRIE